MDTNCSKTIEVLIGDFDSLDTWIYFGSGDDDFPNAGFSGSFYNLIKILIKCFEIQVGVCVD